MHIYIPIWVLYVPLAYALIGLVLYVPMVYWSNRFISGNHRAFYRASPRRLILGVLGAALAWPYIVGVCLRWERKFGIFKK